MPQGRNGQPNNGKKLSPAPPVTGAPEASLPSLEETRQRRHVEPRARQPIPSTVRSRRKPLESRQGRKVGDPLPPKKRASTNEFGDGSERVTVAGADRRGYVGTAHSHQARTTRSLPAGIYSSASPATLLRLIDLRRGLSNHSAFDFLHYPTVHSDTRASSVSDLHRTATRSEEAASVLADDVNAESFDLFVPLMPQSGSSKIVFASNRDGSMQIYAMNADGSGQTRLTYSGANDDYPRWSPNGSKIVFQSDRDNPDTGFFDIYVMNADGSGQTRLTTDPNDDSAAVWSPDGSKIAFQSARNGVNYQIYVMNADGSGQMEISENTGIDTGIDTGNGNGNVGGNHTRNGNNNVGSNGQPAWSPDGAKIAFTSDRDDPGVPAIYVMNANGPNQTRLTFDYGGARDEQPAWSPNGAKLAFVSTRNSTLETWQETDDDGNVITKSNLHVNKEIYVMNANGSNQVRLTNTLENDDSPAWSGDGTRIVFRSDRERDCCDPNAQVWMMNPDGNGQVNISSNGFGDYSANWTSIQNQSPVANAGGAYNAATAQTINFNGGGSFDSDGSIVSYSWNFGDGVTGSGAVPLHNYAATGTYTVTLTVTDNLGAQGSATTSATITTSTADAYTQNFIQVALARPPNADEVNYWEDILRAAYAHQQGSMTIAVREMARTIFESADYAARGRNNHEYVYDLYETYLMRYPDAPGWGFWEGQCNSYGREQIRRAFDECGEFAGDVAALTPNGSATTSVSSLLSARVDPNNQTGNQLLARDAEWGLPLLSLPGRAGLDLGLGLSYSSAAVWTRSGPYSYFDEDNGPLSPGFRLGFPTVQEVFFDAQAGVNARVLIAPSGHRVELRQVGTSNVYEAADSSYLQLIDNGEQLTVSSTDGSLMSYTKLHDQWRCTEIKDRNGNYLTINNYWWGDIANITDTLGRVITFNYDGNANLISITQNWAGQPQPHTWATFGWGNIPVQSNLPGIVGTHSGDMIPMLTQVALDDGSYYTFEYNTNGQVNLIRRYTSDNVQRSYIGYNYTLSADSSPLLTGQRVWAENWTGINDVSNEVVTHFGLEGDKHTLTVEGDPNGTVYKESYGAGWQRGLTTQSEVWAGGSLEKTTTTSWTQDSPAPNVNYQTNPRVTETNVVDSDFNHSRTTIGYDTFTLPSGASCSLPNEVYEYDGNAIYRRTHTDYQKDTNYLNARVIGLPLAKLLYEGTSTLVAKTTYVYDWDGEYLQNLPAAPTQHNGGYSTDFVVGRGNLVDVLRWDVTDQNNAAKALESRVGYDIDGSVIFTRDALNHRTTISYGDAFAAGGTDLDAPRSFATFAYPTTITDADGYSSSLRYRYDFGAVTWKQTPQPNVVTNTPGAAQKIEYDSAARLQQVTSLVNNAYTRYQYGPNYAHSYSTVNNVVDEAYSAQVFDGLGRVIASAHDHPTTNGGGYSAVVTVYDRMGRAIQQSNPTDTSASGSTWQATGDDLANGWIYTQQTYDWKGRPRTTTNPSITGNPNDTTAREASYSACGCAGSEVVTLTDEMDRQQKIYHDALGRVAKTEVLNWNSTVYATTVNTYNARDQVTLARQFQGTDQSGAYQDTTMSYDGYGRLQTKHLPEQNSGMATVYAYNSDDTVQSVTDARGASATYSYNNNRRLVNGIISYAPPGVANTPNVSFGYDAAGNRTSMTDGLGSVSYSYDQLSRLTSETRYFSALSSSPTGGNYGISYQYNLANELTSVTDPFGAQMSYNRDTAGRVASVTGSGAANISTYASTIQYRAWGGQKSVIYGDGTSATTSYNSRMQPSSYLLPGLREQFQYYDDGRLHQMTDLDDRGQDTGYPDTARHFSRAQSYDQVGRLVSATGTLGLPYNQSYSYDEFGNSTSRSGSYYYQGWSSDGGTFQNNRRQDLSYDADGNVTHTPSYDYAGGSVVSFRDWTYDAAGRMSQVKETVTANNSVSTYISSYDGDGQPVVEYDQENLATKSFVVRSSVLGGNVLTRLDNVGNKSSTVFDVDGQLKVVQNVYSSGSSVRWTHIDPFGLSEAGDTKPVYDPMGNYIQWQHMPTYPPPGAIPPIAASYGGLGPSFGYAINSACVLDGIPTDCSLALTMLDHGSAAQCPNNDCSPQPIPYIDPDTGKPGNAGWLSFNGSGFWVSDGSESDYLDPDDLEEGGMLDAFSAYFVTPKRAPRRHRVRSLRGRVQGVMIGEGIVGGAVGGTNQNSTVRAAESGFPDYRSVELGTNYLGPDVGIVIKVDRNIRCYLGVKGGAGFSMFPVSASYMDGRVYNKNNQRTSDPQSVRNALSGFSWSGQFTLPTTDSLGGSLNTDSILGNFPTGARTLEGGNSINIPAAASVAKEYSIKIPWLPYACRK
jgi:YD repeat-containing protein